MRPRGMALLALAGVLVIGGSAAAATLSGPPAHQVQRITFVRAQGQSMTCPTERHCHFDPGGRPMIANFTSPTQPFSATLTISYDYRVSRNTECLLLGTLGSTASPTGQAAPAYRRIPTGRGSATAVFSVPGVTPSVTYNVNANIKMAAQQGAHCALSKLVVTLDAQT